MTQWQNWKFYICACANSGSHQSGNSGKNLTMFSSQGNQENCFKIREISGNFVWPGEWEHCKLLYGWSFEELCFLLRSSETRLSKLAWCLQNVVAFCWRWTEKRIRMAWDWDRFFFWMQSWTTAWLNWGCWRRGVNTTSLCCLGWNTTPQRRWSACTERLTFRREVTVLLLSTIQWIVSTM